MDEICPYFLMYGMSWDEFWYESIDRFEVYWQKHQLKKEARNQELWLQGLYFREAIDSAFDSKHERKYPEKPHRITALSKAEEELEAERKIEAMRAMFTERKRRWDEKHQGGVKGA